MNEGGFCIIGGDRRIAYLARYLASEGESVRCFGVSEAVNVSPALRCDTFKASLDGTKKLILPLPSTKDGKTVFSDEEAGKLKLSYVLESAGKNRLIFGGLIPEEYAQMENITDYFEREELVVLNAIPTAEGAIRLAMEHMQITMHSAQCLVMGFGRVAKALAVDLAGIGAHVAVAVRSDRDISYAELYGYDSVKLSELNESIGRYDVIFNTIPVMLLTDEALRHVKSSAYLIDLASAPGGIDIAAAQRLGIRAERASSLPGKYAPQSAGEMIGITIMNILREMGR